MAIVLSMLSDEQNVAQLARQHGVHESRLYRWKALFLDCGRRGLGGSKASSGEQRLKAENEQLKKLLGEKALEVDSLKNCQRARFPAQGGRNSVCRRDPG